MAETQTEKKVRRAPPAARARPNRPPPPAPGPHASLSFLRVAPRKVRLVADQLRGMLWVRRAWVDEGPTLKRFRPRAQGRGYRINKRTSHITVVVSDDTEGGNR